MLPKETITAVFPPAVTVGRFTVPPMTLAHAVALEDFGIDSTGELSTQDTVLAVYLLRLSAFDLAQACADKSAVRAASLKWAASIRPAEFVSLAQALYESIAAAYSTAVPGKKEEGAQNPPVCHPASDGR